MTKLFWPAVIGSVISAVAVLGTSHLVMSTMPDNVMYAAMAFYVVGMVVLFWRVSQSGGFAPLLRLGVVMTAVAVVEIQVENLLWSGGMSIAKDFTPFTWAHLMHTLLWLGTVGVCFGVLVVVVYAARRGARWGARDKSRVRARG